MKKFIGKYIHALPVIIYAIIYLSWFVHIEHRVTTNYRVIHMALDDYIPFLEIFVIPYVIWFAYVSGVVLCFFFLDKNDYYKNLAFLFTGMTLFLIISTIWPNGHHLRPLVMPRDNIFTRFVSFIYQTDTPTNLWPSIHVYNSIGAHLAIVRSKHFADRPKIKFVSFTIATSIILSTLFIKQHSLFDVITAFILSFVMYIAVYRHDYILLLKQKLHNIRKKARPEAI